MSTIEAAGLTKRYGRPGLLILDEPVNGLDPAGVVEIHTLLAGPAREHGMTVFLSSHLLAEVARLATGVGVTPPRPPDPGTPHRCPGRASAPPPDRDHPRRR